MELLLLSSGVIIGLLLALLVVIVEKEVIKTNKEIDAREIISKGKAEIIKKETPIEEFLHEHE